MTDAFESLPEELKAKWWWFQPKCHNLLDDTFAWIGWETLRRTEAYRMVWKTYRIFVERLEKRSSEIPLSPFEALSFDFAKKIELESALWSSMPFPKAALLTAECDPGKTWLELSTGQHQSVRAAIPLWQRQSPPLEKPPETRPLSLGVLKLRQDESGKMRIADWQWAGSGFEITGLWKTDRFQEAMSVLKEQRCLVAAFFDVRQSVANLRLQIEGAFRSYTGSRSPKYPSLWKPTPPAEDFSRKDWAIIPSTDPATAVFCMPAEVDQGNFVNRFLSANDPRERSGWLDSCMKTWLEESPQILARIDWTVTRVKSGMPCRKHLIFGFAEHDLQDRAFAGAVKKAVRLSLLCLFLGDYPSRGARKPTQAKFLKFKQAFKRYLNAAERDWSAILVRLQSNTAEQKK